MCVVGNIGRAEKEVCREIQPQEILPLSNSRYKNTEKRISLTRFPPLAHLSPEWNTLKLGEGKSIIKETEQLESKNGKKQEKYKSKL